MVFIKKYCSLLFKLLHSSQYIGGMMFLICLVFFTQVYANNFIKFPDFEKPIHLKSHSKVTSLKSTHYNRFIGFKVLHIALQVKIDPIHGKIKGIAALKIRPNKNIREITLDAYQMEIQSVYLKNSLEKLVYSYEDDLLTIHLPKDKKSTLIIHYKANAPQNLYLAKRDPTDPKRMASGYTYSQPFGAQKWFPCLDMPNSKSPMDLTFQIPREYKVLSNGILKNVKHTAFESIYTYQVKDPIAPYLVSINFGDYDIIDMGSFKGKKLALWTPPSIREKAIISTQETMTMMKVFSDYLGIDYPFQTYNQSVAQAFSVSMEHQSATTMGGWRISGDGTGTGVVAHELAHQWFGDFITCEHWGELWLNEGFASFLPALYFEKTQQTNFMLGYQDYWRQSYFKEAKTFVRPLSTPDPNTEDIFDDHAYSKGALIINFIRTLTLQNSNFSKKELFSKVLSHYLKSHEFNTVTNRNLQDSLEKITGKSWQLFFDQWVRSIGHPKINVSWSYSGNILKINLKQTQSWRSFSFPLDIIIVDTFGNKIKKTLQVYKKHHVFKIRENAVPKALVLDPHWKVPMEATLVQSQEAQLFAFQTRPPIKSRLDIMRKLLSTSLSPKLISIIKKDPSPYLLVDAIEILSQDNKNVESIKLIVNALKKKNSDRMVIAALALARKYIFINENKNEDELKIQKEYLQSNYTRERKALMEMLAFIDLERAQKFALDRFQESSWVTYDREYMVQLLSEKITPTGIPFIHSIIKKSSYRWFGQVTRNLIKLNYDSKEIVDSLINRVKYSRRQRIKVLSINLLAKQTRSKNKVCAFLDSILKSVTGHHGSIREAKKELNCEN